jgi:hypothetical protein
VCDVLFLRVAVDKEVIYEANAEAGEAELGQL